MGEQSYRLRLQGPPHASIVGFDSRLHTIDEILNVTTKPLIVDGDTGGEPAQFEYLVRDLERRGVSAVIVEDKLYPKRNSLDASASQSLEHPRTFAEKIQAGKEVASTSDFMIIARLESLIAGIGLRDALQRAEQYIEAGVDGIMIHSAKKDPAEILAFAAAYDPLCRRLGRRPFLVGVPTTYNAITDTALAGHGFNIIIHANHLLRAAYKAMKEAARTILVADRSLEANTLCVPVSEIFTTVGFDRITAKDRERSAGRRVPVVIPAAGRDSTFPRAPKSLIGLAGRHLIDFQLEAIHKVGLDRVVVVRGHEGGQFDTAGYASRGVTFCDNRRHQDTFDLFSIFQAEEYLDNGFALVYSDILFDPRILEQLLDCNRDIVLAVDNSYRYHRHEIDKRLDLAVSRQKRTLAHRSLHQTALIELAGLGKDISVDVADYEFIGMAAFSRRGAEILRDRYHQCSRNVQGRFHEASSFAGASLTDLLQDLIDHGVTVHGLEVHKGWLRCTIPKTSRWPSGSCCHFSRATRHRPNFHRQLAPNSYILAVARLLARGADIAGAMLTTSDRNGYYRSNASAPPSLVEWWRGTARTLYPVLPGYQTGTGRDLSSLGIDGAAVNPFFEDEAAGNFTLRTDSLARNRGVTLPADIADAIGVSATGSPNLGALVLPGGRLVSP